MGTSRYISVLSAVLFLALCAYIGAELYPGGRKNTVTVSRASVSDCVELTGIALREEQSLDCSGSAENGARIPAGAVCAIDGSGTELRSPTSAVFFSECDGYEYLTPADGESLTVSALDALLNAEPRERGRARLVTGRAWYYAAFVPADAALPAKGLCRITPDETGETLTAYIVSVSAAESGKRALLLRLTDDSPACLSLRHFSASLASKEYSGLMIPEAALRQDEEGNDYVITATAGTELKAPVEIIYRGAGFCLVTPEDRDILRDGSRVILDR